MASKKKSIAPSANGDFESLVVSIVQIHEQAQEFATKAVNVGLTLRNWLIGRQIEVYERQGADRATYGDKLMDALAARLKKQGWERCDRRELYRFRHFYNTYPGIVESLTPQSLILPEWQPLMALLPKSSIPIRETVNPESQIVVAATPQLIHRLSFTHFSELIQLAPPAPGHTTAAGLDRRAVRRFEKFAPPARFVADHQGHPQSLAGLL